MNRRSLGFTLVEMLVALTIFSMLLGVLMTGYSQGLLMWEKGNSSSTRWLSMQNRHELMRRLFINAVVADYRGENGVTYPFFVADQDRVELITQLPILDQAGRVRPVRYLVERNEDGMVHLSYQEAARYGDLGRGIRWDDEREVSLLRDLQHISLRYLAPAFPLPQELALATLSREEQLRYRDSPEWLNWYDTAILWRPPVAIELSFADESGVKHQWLFRVPEKTDAWSLGDQIDVL